jgi:hypothetical protein
MFRITNVVLSSALTILLTSCSEAPTSPVDTADLPQGQRAVTALAVASSSVCTVSSTPEFTATLNWSKLPVERIVLWHSLLVRSYTHTLNHSTRNGSLTVRMEFEPVLAVFYNREGVELARQSCS